MPTASTSSYPFSPAELSYLHTSLSSIPPIRLDSRTSTDFRPLNAETGVLPAANGSAHVSFSDGSEAIVGVKLEVEKTALPTGGSDGPENGDKMDVDAMGKTAKVVQKGRPQWVTLTLNLPGTRDDDADLIFLEEMLREPLITPSSTTTSTTTGASPPNSLQDRLVINTRWHWHIYIDVLLISSHGLASYPLPLLSMATHLALRDTRVPKLKSEGEEDPIADDDWMASVYLFPNSTHDDSKPPVTLLIVVVGESVMFDPSHEELKVADGVVALSIGGDSNTGYRMLALRTIDTQARDTLKGVPRQGEMEEGQDVQGVWKPRLGGIKRKVVKNVAKAVLGGGVAAEVMGGLDGFLSKESSSGQRLVSG